MISVFPTLVTVEIDTSKQYATNTTRFHGHAMAMSFARYSITKNYTLAFHQHAKSRSNIEQHRNQV